ncbi:uncharacterized protein LOC111285268 [Durio zibethinus]|uniref:Uncharacterized protein LOC111285268 n=1 Tax=Durio zibethinus TaxID=66656 RepID=A0A6P5XPV0_DURZI|nr:uncharacterized protein LOC111285268 [Durio zibethinus]
MKKKKKMKVENMRQGEEREEGENYDNDPEFAEILGSCLDDPQKVGPKYVKTWSFDKLICRKWFVLLIDGDDWMLRMRKKRNKILHTKTGSGTPMKVTFYK